MKEVGGDGNTVPHVHIESCSGGTSWEINEHGSDENVGRKKGAVGEASGNH